MSDLPFSSPFKSGLRDCMAAPGWGVFAAMAGFGSIAGEAGQPLWRSIALMAGLWSMPGQITFIELSGQAVPTWIIIASVVLANVRMFPVTLASIPLLRGKKGFAPHHLWLAQINSVTSYVQLLDVTPRIGDRHDRSRYFEGFCIGTLLLGAVGTIFGHSAANLLPHDAVRLLLFATPLYLLLLSGRAQTSMMLAAAALGCVFVPLAHLWSVNLGIVIGGLIGGTIAFVAFERERPE